MNKKKILAIVLVIVVLLLAGASIYVATQLSTKQAVAPNAPTSKPAAADCTSLTTLTACDAQTTPDCAWYAACSKCANTGTALTTVCPEWTGSAECTLTGTATATASSTLTMTKKAYLDDATKTIGNYVPLTEITTVKPGQTFVYEMLPTNAGEATISAVTITDTLPAGLTYKESNGCSNASGVVTCSRTNLSPNFHATFRIRVTVSSDIAEGTVISNKAISSYEGKTLETTNTLTVKNDTVAATITGSKTAYKNVTSNTPGVYTLTTLMDTVSKSQMYVYSFDLKNEGTATAAGVTIKDSLKDIASLTFMDAVSGCNYNTTEKEISCVTTLKPGETKTFSFRVKAVDSIANGEVISNTAKVTFPGGSLDLKKDLAVSTVVSCNHTCTVDAECSSGLTCNTTTNKCRLATCATEEDCVCGVIATVTKAAPTAVKTIAPTKVATAAATPSILPESGIFDLPGIAAFGGGLLLAVIGILLAL